MIGEYKWMPIGSTMPEGWFKVKLDQGHTIVQGLTKGKTEGNVAKHNHFYGDNRSRVTSTTTKDSSGNPNYFYADLRGGEIIPNHFIMFVKNRNHFINSDATSFEGDGVSKEKNNLAAGIYGELWQYQGIKEKIEYVCCKKVTTYPNSEDNDLLNNETNSCYNKELEKMLNFDK